MRRYEDLVQELEDIIRNDFDNLLDIPSFFQRVMASIEENGIKFTAMIYVLPIELVKDIQDYMYN